MRRVSFAQRFNCTASLRAFCLLVLIPCSKFSAQQATLSAVADSLRIGEQMVLELRLTIPIEAGSNVYWPSFADTLGHEVEILKESDIDTLPQSLAAQNQMTLRQRLTITCWQQGVWNIPPVAFLVAGDTVKSNAFKLKVSAPLVNPDEGFKDIKDIYEIETPLEKALRSYRWVWISMLVMAAIAIAAYLWWKKGRKSPVAESILPPMPPAKWALLQLNDLEQKQLWQQGLTKEYHTELSDIMRTYLERQFGIRALEETTSHILTQLGRSSFPSVAVSSLKQLLQLADMVKFAKLEPSGYQNEYAMAEARRIVMAAEETQVSA